MTALGNDVWTIILAAGDGTRLEALTRALHGCHVPKQFATIQSGRSLLQATLARAGSLSPPERTVVVVARDHEELARSQLEPYPGVRMVAQPRNLGTGPGLLLPVAHVLAEDPVARVVILPSDHYVRNHDSFIDSIVRAEAVSRERCSVVLLGAEPDSAETQYGWIVGARSEGTGERRVACFREKPSRSEAKELLRAGAFWNTFIMTGAAEEFWELGRRHLPERVLLLDAYRREIGSDVALELLDAIYERMRPADFSGDVLERASRLGVAPLAPCGWSDWGTPSRVLESLRGTADLARLKQRLRAAVRTANHGEAATVMALAALAS